MRRTLERWAQGLGTGGVIAVGLLLFNAGALINGALPLRERQVALEASLARATAAAASKVIPAASARDPVRGFHDFFPRYRDVPDVLDALFKAAGRQGLELAQAEYRSEPGADGIVAYRIVTAAKGSYVDVRAFIMRALNDTPQLALESIRFERQKARDEQIEAQLRFTLYLRRQER